MAIECKDSAMGIHLPEILQKLQIGGLSVARSGDEALSIIDAEPTPFDIILLNSIISDTSTLDLFQSIRKLSSYEKMPVMMLMPEKECEFTAEQLGKQIREIVANPIGKPVMCLLAEQAATLTHPYASDRSEDELETKYIDPIKLPGINGAVSVYAFDNYLARLSKAGYQSVKLFAVHVMDSYELFEQCAESEFANIIGQVADALLCVPELDRLLVCYLGKGNFMCSSNAENLGTPYEVEVAIQDILDDKALTYDDGTPLDIELAVGACIHPFWSQSSKLESLAPQAVKRAMIRVEEKSRLVRNINIRRVARPR